MFRQPFNWREIERLRRDMDRLFEISVPRLPRTRAARFPAVNVWTNDQEGVLCPLNYRVFLQRHSISLQRPTRLRSAVLGCLRIYLKGRSIIDGSVTG